MSQRIASIIRIMIPMDVLKHYNICNNLFEINGIVLDDYWRPFQTSLRSEHKCKISFVSGVYFNGGLELFELNEKKRKIFRKDTEIMITDDKWEKIEILLYANYEMAASFLLTIFLSKAVTRSMLQLHSSLIDHRGHGLMFLGPSGIGKTTQAELWNRYRDALIINGDIVFVQETDDGFLGWGTPWHGSSPYCENTSVPLKAMIVLKQAPENSIRELTGFEKVTEVSNSVFYPQWLENGMELCLETLDHLLTRIPVYELSCRPDEDAVRLAEEAVFGSCG